MSQESPAYVEPTREGGWRLTGSRVSLDSIVHAYWQGRTPEVIAHEFPSLTLEQVHGAIAFYLRNRERIDAFLESQNQRWEEFRHESDSRHARLLQRIRSASGSGQGDVK